MTPETHSDIERASPHHTVTNDKDSPSHSSLVPTKANDTSLQVPETPATPQGLSAYLLFPVNNTID
jgi:hypothetical protein